MPPPARRTTILVVEDDPALREFYRRILINAGYGVVAVEDGMDALRVVEHGTVPQAIVLDLALPRLGGRDVLQELQSHAQTRNIPIIVVSGTDTRGLTNDVACVMRKPVTAEQFIEAVAKCLRGFGSKASQKED